MRQQKPHQFHLRYFRVPPPVVELNAERFLTYGQSTADFQFHCYQIYAWQRFILDVSPRYEHKESLRKTSSMPSVEQTQQVSPLFTLFFNGSSANVWGTPRQSLVPEPVDTESDDEIINTDIEELRDAAQSIQSLQRVLKVPPEAASKNGIR
ncbi:unnamed protein product [Gongylonema pulchrum]|uniref:Mediator of RNA polymerase II transcription subunit 6 n=1 Tax=Gongylonema pulchrum TaxID=637853 RepID=A0A183EL77_9BILA|nr:unnamed protein product [Gongylonema pulchrum]